MGALPTDDFERRAPQHADKRDPKADGEHGLVQFGLPPLSTAVQRSSTRAVCSIPQGEEGHARGMRRRLEPQVGRVGYAAAIRESDLD